MSLTKTKQPFLALSKICLNNWHYIDQKILSFNDGINFFTGHSGSGKSTTGRSIIRLYDPTEGTILFNGEDISKKLTAKQEKMLRSDMQMVFQDPMASLNPHKHMRFYASLQVLLPPGKTFPFPARVLKVPV